MLDRVNTADATLLGRALVGADRATLEAFITAAIDLLDLADGDPDIEPNGDELDGSLDEDDFHTQDVQALGFPGCPLADAAEDDDPAGDPLDQGEIDVLDGMADTFSDRTYYREQRDRIRGERCFPIERRWRDCGRVHVEVAGYELMREPRVPSRRQLLGRRRGMPRQVRP